MIHQKFNIEEKLQLEGPYQHCFDARFRALISMSLTNPSRR
jgi:hypothetical protein